MYTLNATFDAHVDQEKTLAAVLEALPEGTQASLELEPILLDVSDLGDNHVGSSIRGYIGTDQEFAGVIEAVVPAYGGGVSVVADGKAYVLSIWDAVQVTPPVTVGEHTTDEPEVEESFDMAVDDYNAAVDLIVQVQQSVEPYAIPSAGWLTRPMVEAITGRPLTDGEFAVLSGSVALHLTRVVDSVAQVVVAQHWALLQEVEADNA